MKAVLFCRVSSREQEETGYSLPAQKKYLRDYAQRNNFSIAKIFAVSESASGKVQRKVFNEMINFIRKNNISVVIVETTDRLTRNFADVPLIDKWILEDESHQIHLAKEGCILHKESKSHEWFMWRVKVATAEYYVRLLSENVKKGQREKIRQGWLPTKPPLGYKTIGEKGHKIHVIDEEKAPLVKKMFELYATGNYSLKRLTETMYKEGLRNNYGHKVPKSRIHEFLTDPFYIGKIRWNGEIYEGKHQPLIEKETFEKVQRLLKSKTTPKYNKHLFLFTGLIRCKECGGVITWEIAKGRYIYGHCNHYRNCSQQTWAKESEVENQLIPAFENLQIKSPRLAEWIRKALKESHKDEIEYHSSALNELNQKYNQIQQRLDKLYDDKLDGNITEEFYNRKFQQYTEEKEKVLEAIEKHSQASNKYFELGINIYELSQKAKEIYLKAPLEQKRQLVSLVFTNLLLDEGKLSYTYSKPFQILFQAVQATNSSKIAKLTKNGKEIFEPSERGYITEQTDDLEAYRPSWLACQDRSFYLHSFKCRKTQTFPQAWNHNQIRSVI